MNEIEKLKEQLMELRWGTHHPVCNSGQADVLVSFIVDREADLLSRAEKAERQLEAYQKVMIQRGATFEKMAMQGNMTVELLVPISLRKILDDLIAAEKKLKATDIINTGRLTEFLKHLDAEIVPHLEKDLSEARAALVRIKTKQPDVLAMLRRNDFIFDDSNGRWEKLAFTLYTDICELSMIAEEALSTPKIPNQEGV